jgi:hypothetical protein
MISQTIYSCTKRRQMMEKIKLAVIFTLLILLSVFHFGCPKPPQPPPQIGQWINGNLNELLVFSNDGTFKTLYIPQNDQALQPGQPVPQRSDNKTWKVSQRGTYEIDFSKNPAWIDLIFTDEQGTQRRLQGLITFLDNNTFYVALEEARPASIDNSSRKTRFTRASPNEIGPIPK